MTETHKHSVFHDDTILIDGATVSFSCHLPKGLGEDPGEASGSLRFDKMPNIVVHLTHHFIIQQLLHGLHTPPDAGIRPFLYPHPGTSTTFAAALGDVTIILTRVEAEDLCMCIDEVGEAYKDRLTETLSLLDLWIYEPVHSTLGHGVHVLTLQKWVWKLLLRFSHEFDWGNGSTSWHCFDKKEGYLWMCNPHEPHQEHALLVPLESGNSSEIDLIYVYPRFETFETWFQTPWQQTVGPYGLWTATHTQQWLINTFIPHALTLYNARILSHPQSRVICKALSFLPWGWHLFHCFASKIEGPSLTSLISRRPTPFDIPILPESRSIDTTRDLVPYIAEIQQWLNLCGDGTIDATLLRRYYALCTNLAHRAIFRRTPIGIPYLAGNLSCQATTYQEILTCLDSHVVRINQSEREDATEADFISRTFLDILRHGAITLDPEHLQRGASTIITLWEIARFDQRYRWQYAHDERRKIYA